jgi:polyphosphate:AMP phosphotransferase
VFEAAEIGSEVAKDEFEAWLPQLRVDLVNAQYDLCEADFPVLIILVGDDRPGVSEAVNRLNEWMDARFVHTNVFGAPTDEELQHPRFWRYWRALPGRGQLSVYTGDWVLGTIAERLLDAIDEKEFERRLAHMERFERELADSGALVVKLWLHLPKKEFKKRVKKARKNDDDGWRLDGIDLRIYDAYDEMLPLAEHVLRKTDPGGFPWQIVESTDARHRDLTLATAILEALRTRLEQQAPAEPPPAPESSGRKSTATVLAGVDLKATVSRSDYREERETLQARLRKLTLRARKEGVSSVLVFEGWDAAGKGGVIRRLSQAMDVQDYRIVPVAAPSDEELRHHYLWRFWRQIPRRGRMVVFDRSWYGRVLVERVENLTPEADWQRSYAEINDFEEQLFEEGVLLAKFWLHIDPDEQLRRFQARELTAYKKYKITDEDYRNRDRWGDYEQAVHEMVTRTSSELAPWHLVPAVDKRVARLDVLRKVCDGLGRRLGEK